MYVPEVDIRSASDDLPLSPAAGKRPAGLIGSILLHLAVLFLLIFKLPDLLQPPAPATLPIPVNLVRLGPATTAPPAPRIADMPQERAMETPLHRPVQAGVTPQAASPMPSKSDTLTAIDTRMPRKPAETKVANQAKAEVKLASREHPAPPDALAMRLKQLAQLKQVSTPLQTDQPDQNGMGISNVTASSANAGRGLEAAYSTKDFIRAQIIRHWNLNTGAPKVAEWTVSIHLKVKPDGTVGLAEIVDVARYRPNRPYFDFALSARNAAYLASPLTIPAGQYALVKDIVIDFSARQVLQ